MEMRDFLKKMKVEGMSIVSFFFNFAWKSLKCKEPVRHPLHG